MSPQARRHGPAPARPPGDRSAPTVDLHTHTTRSDGILSPAALVRDAATAGIRTLAITDHDSLAGIRDLDGTGPGTIPPSLELIPGIEINATGAWQMGGVGEGELHILGYGVDPDDDRFEATLVTQRDGRRRRFQAMVDRLRELDLPIDREVEAISGSEGDALGRPTVARCLISAGYAVSVEDAFERLLSRGRPAYLPREGLGPIEAIEAIRRSGGIPVLAHYAEAASHRDVLTELKDAGLAGLEVYYRSFDDGTIATLAALAEELGLVATGGSDYHGDDGSYAERLIDLHIPDEVGSDLLLRLADDRR